MLKNVLALAAVFGADSSGEIALAGRALAVEAASFLAAVGQRPVIGAASACLGSVPLGHEIRPSSEVGGS